MPRGDKSKYTDKQKRKAEHIEEGYRERGSAGGRGGAPGLGDGEQGIRRREQVGQRPGRAGHEGVEQEGRADRRRGGGEPAGGGAQGFGPEGRRDAEASSRTVSDAFS